jgi:hypothetical protein
MTEDSKSRRDLLFKDELIMIGKGRTVSHVEKTAISQNFALMYNLRNVSNVERMVIFLEIAPTNPNGHEIMSR